MNKKLVYIFKKRIEIFIINEIIYINYIIWSEFELQSKGFILKQSIFTSLEFDLPSL